jgi:hypothetical protein
MLIADVSYVPSWRIRISDPSLRPHNEILFCLMMSGEYLYLTCDDVEAIEI